MIKQSLLLCCLFTTAFPGMHAQVNERIPMEYMVNKQAYTAKRPFTQSIVAKFHQDYPKVTNDAWATLSKGYLVNFTMDEISYTVFMDMKGNLTSQIRYYQDDQLPRAVRKKVREFFGCYTIRSVKEITALNTTVYLVTVEDNVRWKIVRITDSEMDVLEEYEKD